MARDTTITVYLSQEERDEILRRYHEDGSKKVSVFVRNAVMFYLAYLHAKQDGDYLPPALQAVLEGQLGMLRNHMAKLLYKLAVEQDMMMILLADSFDYDEEYLRKLRGRSISHVKQTNGQLTFEQVIRKQELEGWPS